MNDTFPQENNIYNIVGFISTLEEIPTYVPRRFVEQIVLVTNGGSTRAYLYDRANTSWVYATLT